VIGLLGTTLDAGLRRASAGRSWRPTVALSPSNPDFHVDRFELIVHPPGEATQLAEPGDRRYRLACRPSTQVVPPPLAIANPWDFESRCSPPSSTSPHGYP
jgi:sigma54-dependent transcription regulator